jgi:hypothetical protein
VTVFQVFFNVTADAWTVETQAQYVQIATPAWVSYRHVIVVHLNDPIGQIYGYNQLMLPVISTPKYLSLLVAKILRPVRRLAWLQ